MSQFYVFRINSTLVRMLAGVVGRCHFCESGGKSNESFQKWQFVNFSILALQKKGLVPSLGSLYGGGKLKDRW